VTVILGLGPKLRIGGPDQAPGEYDSFIAAVNDSYAITEYDGVSRGVQVDLSPFGAHMLFGVAMHELAELVVPLDDVLGSAAPLLVERLDDAPSWEARFELLDSIIGARISDARRPSPDVAWAWRRLLETDGRLPIGALTDELGCSRRHLIARFREQIGPAPKTAARILRFRRATRLLARDDGRRFVEIAADCGYYDQAHLNRDFRDLAGTAPSEYLAQRLPDGFGTTAG
jgi:AraC-like DNA-binding protein